MKWLWKRPLGIVSKAFLLPRSESAITAVGLLKEERAGRSTFFNGDLMEDTRRQSFQIPEDDTRVKGYLKDLIKVPEQHQKTLAHILDGVVVVDTLQTALQLRPALQRLFFCNFRRRCSLPRRKPHGGSSEGVDSGLLKQKREIKELNLRRDEASGKFALAVASLRKT